MSNEIQVSSFGGAGLPMQPGMGGGGLGGYYGGQQPPTEESPFKKVHKLLRGRYLLAFVLGLLGAAAGAVGGYISQKPAFKAEGMIEINPKIIDPGLGKETVMAMFSSYVNSQMAKLQSDVLIKQAMKDPRWQAVRPGPVTDVAIAAFSEKLTVTLPPKSNTLIVIGYSDSAADIQKVAPAAIQSLLDAYKNDYDKDDALSIDKKIENAEKSDQAINNQIATKRQRIQTLSKTSDGDPTQVRAYELELFEQDKQLSRIREAIAAVKQAAIDRKDPPTAEDWAAVDSTMASKIKLRDDLALIIGNLIAHLGGPNHPQVLSRRRELDSVNAYINEMAKTLDAKFVIRSNLDGSRSTVTKDTKAMAEMEKRLVEDLNRRQANLSTLREVAAEIDTLKFDISDLGARSKQLAQDLKDLKFRKDNTNLAKVLNTGSVAKPDKDRRPVFAAIGFMGGACVPVALLMLFGLFDTRYRFSDETSASVGAGPGGLTLLGILPNLPDRLSDPEQAAIAAHCVHQIRTMLQINAGMEDRRVFAVTSASPGDGKTSLCLALGLSYAACGTRTLLIDCDLIGSGLSSMNVNAPEGVLEAIANRTMAPYVRQTDVNDVSILPCGSASNLHASTLSPQSLRRLIEEAEQHYEVILIDTGPILGSIEASLVCAAADAVILTVARGQQRPMVERSLSHLQAIGAKLAGVVFNRAQAQDFERSISGVSIRSVGVPGMPRGHRSTGPRLGPVARAVQGQPGDAPAEDNGEGQS